MLRQDKKCSLISNMIWLWSYLLAKIITVEISRYHFILIKIHAFKTSSLIFMVRRFPALKLMVRVLALPSMFTFKTMSSKSLRKSFWRWERKILLSYNLRIPTSTMVLAFISTLIQMKKELISFHIVSHISVIDGFHALISQICGQQ